MEKKHVIAIVGQCPNNLKDNLSFVKMYKENISPDEEINIFDYPRIGGADVVEHETNVYIHRYANPSVHLRDAIQRDWEIVRDLVALGVELCIIQKCVDKELLTLRERIKKAMILYGIKYQLK